MENAILVLRAKHPSWGARKLKARLEMLQPELVWPAASTFGNILSRAGLTSPQRKRKRITPCSEPFSTVTGPNQLWCMDFKGYFVTGDGKRCDPFTITDAYSRYLIRCQIVSRIDLSQVRAICEAAMREYGMPARPVSITPVLYDCHAYCRSSRTPKGFYCEKSITVATSAGTRPEFSLAKYSASKSSHLS
jgi:transposase InsO family protein